MNGGRRHINDTDSIATERAVNNQAKREREREIEDVAEACAGLYAWPEPLNSELTVTIPSAIRLESKGIDV